MTADHSPASPHAPMPHQLTPEAATEIVRAALADVATEADLADVGPDQTLQEGLDLDSIDFLDFVVEIHRRTGLEIPERDYPILSTLDGCVDYLTAHAPRADGA